MTDKKQVMYDIERCICHVPDACRDCCHVPDACRDFSHYTGTVGFGCMENLMTDALALLKEQDNLLGIHQTANGITLISSGTAKQGEDRGIMLGKAYMHEWLQKELLHKGLLTDEIRKVFADAKSL